MKSERRDYPFIILQQHVTENRMKQWHPFKVVMFWQSFFHQHQKNAYKKISGNDPF